MLLVIRVSLTILFSAFVLWSQTLGADFGPVLPAAESAQLKVPSLKISVPQKEDRFTFKLNLPPLAPDLGRTILAENAFPPIPARTASAQAPARPRAVTYSQGYEVRAKIHKYASIATLPLIIAESIVGQKLFDETNNSSLRSAHTGLAAGLGVLFGVNSVTGVWNMMEARKDPSGRKKIMFHGILMLAADAGFVATTALAPHHEDRSEPGGNSRDPSTHRAVAFASFGVATVSYVYMLIAK